MTSAQRSYRARVFADVNRRSRLGSITWGTRALGFVSPAGDVTDMNTVSMGPVSPGLIQSFPGNPDTRPGAWPGLVAQTSPPVQANGGPGQVPVVVTPTSGSIPPPATVAAAAAAPASWLDESMIGGIANKYLLMGGIAALFLLGGKK